MSDIRLIDANALIEKLQSYYESLNPEVYSEYIRRHEASFCIAELTNTPTIDAQPARYGKWVETVVRGTPSIYCSMCGSESPVCYPLNFCPDCGAEMCGSDRNETD